jgi:hypothetical protein
MKTSGKLGFATISATLGLMGAFWPGMVSEELQQGGVTNLVLVFALMAAAATLFLGLGARRASSYYTRHSEYRELTAPSPVDQKFLLQNGCLTLWIP